MAAGEALGEVRVAGVIDDLGTAAADGPVEHVAFVESKQADFLFVAGRSPNFFETGDGFALGDALAGVLDDFAVCGDVFEREDAEALNGRSVDAKPPASGRWSDLRVERRGGCPEFGSVKRE